MEIYFSAVGNSDGEVDSDKEDGNENNKKENVEKSTKEGNSNNIILLKNNLYYVSLNAIFCNKNVFRC